MSKVVVLIPAAGTGKRMGKARAKQFLLLGDKPLLAHTLLAFQRAPEIDEIIPIVSQDDVEDCLRDIIEPYRISKVKTLVVGGKERHDSVLNGLQKIGKDTTVVLVHDGVRPFVTPEMIRETVGFAKEGECVAVGVPIKDTIMQLILDKYFPHLRPGQQYRQGQYYRPITPEELNATAVYRLDVEEWSAKHKSVPQDFPGAFIFGDDPQSL